MDGAASFGSAMDAPANLATRYPPPMKRPHALIRRFAALALASLLLPFAAPAEDKPLNALLVTGIVLFGYLGWIRLAG